MKQRLVAVTVVLVAAVVAAGCGEGGRDIGAVESCLKELKLNVDRSKKSDKDVESGVSATSAPDSKELVIAVAAVAKSDAKVKDFQRKTKELTSGLSEAQEEKFEVDTGRDGRYVWVVAGSRGADDYDAARSCVEA